MFDFDFDLLEKTDAQNAPEKKVEDHQVCGEEVRVTCGVEVTPAHHLKTDEGSSSADAARDKVHIEACIENSTSMTEAEPVPTSRILRFSTLAADVVTELHLHTDVTSVEVKHRLQMRFKIPWVEQHLVVGVGVWENGCSLGDVLQDFGMDNNGLVQVTVLRVPLAKHVAVSGNTDGALIVWDIENGSRLREMKGHDGGVNCVSVHWVSQRAASGGADKSLRTWDLSRGKLLKEMKGHTDEVTCLSMSWANSHAVSGSSDTTLRVWDLDQGKCIVQLSGHSGPVTCVALDEVSWWAISGSEDRSLLIWDLSTGELVQECHGHVSPVRCVSCDAGLKYAASGGWSTLKVWDLRIGKQEPGLKNKHAYHNGFNLLNLSGHTQPITCVSVDWSAPSCLTGSSDTTLRYWAKDTRPTSGMNLSRNPINLQKHTLPVTCVAVDWSAMLAVSGAGDCLFVWDLQEVKALRSLRGREERANVLCVAMDKA